MKIKHSNKLSKRIKELQKLKSSRVTVGFPKGYNAYPDGTAVAMVASVHEFGSVVSNIPPRPFFRPTLIANGNYKKLRIKYFTLIAKDKVSVKIGLNQLGIHVAEDIKDAIVAVSSPVLKEATIKAKGGKTSPLVDSSHLVHSVTHKVDL